MKRLKASRRRGFTRVELASVLACAGLLFLWGVGSGSATRAASERTVCLGNQRRLLASWQAHAADNPFLLGNWTEWGLGSLDWFTGTDNTNVANVLTPAFVPYSGRDPSVFLCPSDRFVSPIQRRLGWRHRVRTYSMNLQVGTVYSGWGGTFPTYRRIQDFTAPQETFVFVEEHPGSINDCSFASDPEGARTPEKARLIDVPVAFHGRATHFGFADGHTELHGWVGSRMIQPVVGGRDLFLNTSAPFDVDVLWLGQHAAQRP